MSTDGGASFDAAVLEPPARSERLAGLAVRLGGERGRARALSSRATDAAGNTQPLDPPWNLKGYANNAVERIPVLVGP